MQCLVYIQAPLHLYHSWTKYYHPHNYIVMRGPNTEPLGHHV